VSERATGRHRAPRRPTTPLTPLSIAVGERVNQINPAGLVVAVSSGLLATGGIPMPTLGSSHASTNTAHVAEVTPHAADAFQESVLSSGAVLTAPQADDTLTFDRAAFTAVPKPPPPAPTVQQATATIARTTNVSRSIRRTTSSRTTTSHMTVSTTAVKSTVRSGVTAIAARYVGVPYVYGGTTPRGFDCSGFVQYVYRQSGISLPRTADQQMRAGRQISRSQARPGDLVAFVSGGSAYHVAIYAGGGMMYDAPHTGSSVGRRAIYSASVVFVRV
jgi:cell wall-associated NlpC family hydrolase